MSGRFFASISTDGCLQLWRNTGISTRVCMNHDFNARPFGVLILTLTLAAGSAWGQTDEIQVYDAAIADPGKFNLTLHNNYTPEGRTNPAFPGGVVPDKSFNGVPEWAYGVTGWFEAGLYFPIYSISRGHGLTFDGLK